MPCSTLAQVCSNPTGSTLNETISAKPMLIDQKLKARGPLRPLDERLGEASLPCGALK
jgi:hypothetical protein